MLKTVNVVMLGYRSLAGKDTCAGFLKDYGYQRKAFADKLKDVVADLYNLRDEQIHGCLKDVEDVRYINYRDSNPSTHFLTARRILQFFGQDQRSIYPDIWAQYIFNAIDYEVLTQDKSEFSYVITDFRFKNEYKVAERWNNTFVDGVEKRLRTIQINRPDVFARSGANDVSENELNDFKDWTHTIINDGSLDDLRAKIVLLTQQFVY